MYIYIYTIALYISVLFINNPIRGKFHNIYIYMHIYSYIYTHIYAYIYIYIYIVKLSAYWIIYKQNRNIKRNGDTLIQ